MARRFALGNQEVAWFASGAHLDSETKKSAHGCTLTQGHSGVCAPFLMQVFFVFSGGILRSQVSGCGPLQVQQQVSQICVSEVSCNITQGGGKNVAAALHCSESSHAQAIYS